MSSQLPIVSSKSPYKVEVEANKKYSWCSCGASKSQPFCDGAHKAFKNEDGSSIMKSITYVADANKTVYFCGCKHSKNGVFCDGTHSKI